MNDNLIAVLLVMVIIGGCVGQNYVDTYEKIELKKIEVLKQDKLIKELK
ncbi:MAG: hypothetical protein ACPG9K_01000 [Poseidonibacter sp.]